MSIVTIENLTVGFRGPPLLDNVSCRITAGQRIGLLGRNGAGKTTLMRLVSGQQEPDSGRIIVDSGIQIAMLGQDVPQKTAGQIDEIVADGLPLVGVENEPDAQWKRQNQVEKILTRMQLISTDRFETMSSGMKRRVLLARALVSQPDLLLLDEPTNHLDIEAINWLESYLEKWPGALMFVTHDRSFLKRMAQRILEIDRGRIFDWTCDYETFLVRKEQALAAENKQNALFDKRLAEEEVWIRQGIKARRTRNEGRVRDLEAMRRERSERRERVGTSNLKINEGNKSGTLVIEAKDISFAYDSENGAKDVIFSELSTTIMRGDKVGIIGPNGIGKTTLLKVLLGQLTSQTGSVRLGSNIKTAYFDQLREQLDTNKTVHENVGDGYDHIGNGEHKKHILGYLQEFLFTPEKARTQVKFLSGGERNRILLAKLFTKTANLIVLDEPTNDLDMETLEMLEHRLVEFNGTVLMVSHDRTFLNNVVTSTLAFENGNVKEYVGGYDDWLRQRPTEKVTIARDVKDRSKSDKKVRENTSSVRKLTFKEKKELEALPEQIDSLEVSIAEIHRTMAEPSFYQQSGDAIASKQDELKTMEQSLSHCYERWEALDALNV